jgi:hypothetical protein
MEVNSQIPGQVATRERAVGTLWIAGWVVARAGIGALEKRNRNIQ